MLPSKAEDVHAEVRQITAGWKPLHFHDEREEIQRRAAPIAEIARTVVEQHQQVLASVSGLRHALLVLHEPHLYDRVDLWPHCEGCDLNGNEPEHPEFPCSTYILARDWEDQK
jgi:hypothetical protein